MTNMHNVIRVGVVRSAGTDGYALVGENDNKIQAQLNGWYSSKSDAMDAAAECYDLTPEDWTGEDEWGYLPGEDDNDDE